MLSRKVVARKTVVTMKKRMRRKAISAVEAVGISDPLERLLIMLFLITPHSLE